jgi:predicted amidohydrolase YtcJ
MTLMRSGWLAASLFLAAACSVSAAPELVIFNGVVHSGVDGAPTAEAVAVKDGRIMAVGTSADLVELAEAGVETVDLRGAHLYPGFTDAHMHLRGVGEREMTLNLDQVASIADLQARIAEAAGALSPGQPLFGRGWIETHWPEQRMPARQDLDAVAADRPVVLTRADGHALVANTRALEAAGLLSANPEQPAGGRIELAADGMPTGVLIDTAMGKVGSLAEAPSRAAISQAYVKGAARYASLGWTGGHNMSVAPDDVAIINALSDKGELPLRIYNAVDGDDPRAFEVMGRSDAALVTTRAIKLYMDGALGSRGALLSAPYSDRPETSGLQVAEEAKVREILKQAYDKGAQVCFHAIGDLGNARVLDWMEALFAAPDASGHTGREGRWRVEHAQILHVEDIPRFARLGVIPSMQPSHAIGDLYFAPARLGTSRLNGAYAWRALIDAGSIIAGGSDAPVEQGDPLIEFYAAVARKDLKGRSGPDWRPDQAVTRAEALKMFTLWPAFASFQEKDLGTIEVGKIADFSGFSGDLLTVPEAEILALKPVLTVVGGAVVWRSPAVAARPE